MNGRVREYNWGSGQPLRNSRRSEGRHSGDKEIGRRENEVDVLGIRYDMRNDESESTEEAGSARDVRQGFEGIFEEDDDIYMEYISQDHGEENNNLRFNMEGMLSENEDEGADEQINDEDFDPESFFNLNINALRRTFPRSNNYGDIPMESSDDEDELNVSLTDSSNSVLKSTPFSCNCIMQMQAYKYIVGKLDVTTYGLGVDADFDFNTHSREECHRENLRRIALIDYQLSKFTHWGRLDVTLDEYMECMDYVLLKILFPNFITLFYCMKKYEKISDLIRHLRKILTYDVPFFLEIPVSPLKKTIKSVGKNNETLFDHRLFPCGLVIFKYDSEVQDQLKAYNKGKEINYIMPNI
uniref:CDC73_C domain-containing protein n=1 Tax=Strongyloides stercoralis TaxID=6248 RepID=A0A0K0EN35_STRER